MIEFLSSSTTPNDKLHDLCVIGAGAAGITIATTMARRGFSVLLAEAGGFSATLESQNHYGGAVVGDPYFDLRGTRLRYFGGSTANWGGLCRELDPYDFTEKTGAAMTAWPISYEDLHPYAADAAAILQVARQRPDQTLNSEINEIFFEFSPPVRFGDEFREEIAESPQISAFLNCNFLGYQYDGSRINGAQFINYDGFRTIVRAKHFVLACGGIENSRILLLENRKFNNELGNKSGLVGRYWSEHHHFTIGDLLLFKDEVFATKPRITPLGTEDTRIFVGASTQFLKRERILNVALRLLPLYERTGAKKYLADLLCTAPDLSNALMGTFGEKLICAGKLRAQWEQVPNIDNRIALSQGTDSFGLSRCTLHWRKSARDKLAPRKAALALGKYLANHDIGRVKVAPWLLRDDDEFPDDDEIGGNHHMGGTRMAEESGNGVVDKNCRVYGTSNLYVAGSSVFPSAGHANPMFTTLQLSLRLAEHLKYVLGV